MPVFLTGTERAQDELLLNKGHKISMVNSWRAFQDVELKMQCLESLAVHFMENSLCSRMQTFNDYVIEALP